MGGAQGARGQAFLKLSLQGKLSVCLAQFVVKESPHVVAYK